MTVQYRPHRREARKYQATNYLVISCPPTAPGLSYKPGWSFSAEDVRVTLKMGHFIPGMVLENHRGLFRVVRCVRNHNQQKLERIHEA